MSSVTMRMVAEVAGVHQTTVSLALRRHPRIPFETAERIRKVAEQMGYRPNPLVAAFAAGRRRRGSGIGATLGYVTIDPVCGIWPYFDLAEGFRQRAGELGYGIDLLWLGDPALTQARFNQITATRNIHGLMIAPVTRQRQSLELSWERFASVAYGFSVSEPRIHRVTPDFYHSMIDLLRRCREGGWRRVGLVLSENTDRKSDHFWLSAFLAEQRTTPFFKTVPPLLLPQWDPESAETWFRRHRPEVVIGLCSMLDLVQPWAEARPGAHLRPQWLALDADAQAIPGHYAGVAVQRMASGAACADLLVGMLQRNERGLPANGLNIFTETGWLDGRSFQSAIP